MTTDCIESGSPVVLDKPRDVGCTSPAMTLDLDEDESPVAAARRPSLRRPRRARRVEQDGPGNSPPTITAVGGDDEEKARWSFPLLLRAQVPGLRILFVDWAEHTARAFIETRLGGHAAEFRYCSESRFATIRVTFRNVKPSEPGRVLLNRIQAGTRARINLAPEDRAVFVEVVVPFFEGSPAEATVASLVEELRSVLENVRLSEALNMK